MNDSQLPKYHVNWAKAWKKLREAGALAADEKKTRMRWHVLIGAVYLRGKEAGQPKSSKHLNNGEIDRFLKRCYATHTPAGLAEQLALDGQPLIRLGHATNPLLDLIEMPMEAREKYLAGIYANVQRKRVREENVRELALAEMPDSDLQLVVVALTHTIEHKLGVAHNHPRAGRGPTSRFDHQVGAKKGQKMGSQTKADRTASHVDPSLAVPEETFDPSAPFG